MKAPTTQREMGAPDLLRAAGLSGQAMRAVSFASILEAGNDGAIPGRAGAYLIVTVADGHVIGIGSSGSGPKRKGTLAARVGTFVAAALGFPVKHSSGRRFWTTRSAHGLRLRDLAVVCLPADDPRGMECKLFDAYEDATGRLPMLCKARPSRRERA